MIRSKRGLLGTILISIALVVLIIGAILFWQIRTNGIQVSSGNFIIEISYNSSSNDSSGNTGQVFQEVVNNTININKSLNNLTKSNFSTNTS